MPGSPYLDEIPRRLLTWPRLLKVGHPMTALLLGIAWYTDVLVEVGIALFVVGMLTAFIPRT